MDWHKTSWTWTPKGLDPKLFETIDSLFAISKITIQRSVGRFRWVPQKVLLLVSTWVGLTTWRKLKLFCMSTGPWRSIPTSKEYSNPETLAIENSAHFFLRSIRDCYVLCDTPVFNSKVLGKLVVAVSLCWHAFTVIHLTCRHGNYVKVFKLLLLSRCIPG